MKAVQISDGIVPIAQFKSRAAHWLKRVVDSGQPLVITVNGKPAGVLISPVEFDRMQERQRLVVSIANGLADAEMGRVMSTKEVEKRLAARRGK